MKVYSGLSLAISGCELALKQTASVVNPGHWQGIDTKDNSDMDTYEVLHHTFRAPMPTSMKVLGNETKANLPWAEMQFQERVAGSGVNPGHTYMHWPHYKHRKENDKFRLEKGKFTHTYAERFWPNQSYDTTQQPPELIDKPTGIRYRYGDYNDVLDLLRREPYTRQAYLPVFFPEDTGAHHQGRIPCTLGYHLILRDGRLHLSYFIRSCDFLRHLRDDIYMAVRLAQWTQYQLSDDPLWETVLMGNFVMHIGSLHMFRADRRALGWNE